MDYKIVYHEQTKVMYIINNNTLSDDYSGGYTVMVNENGKPLLYEEQ